MLNLKQGGTRVAKRLAACTLLGIAVCPLAGCYTSLPALDPLPLLITRDSDGSLTILFDVCQGEALVGVGVATDDGSIQDALGQGSPKELYADTQELSMVVSDASMAASNLISGVPVTVAWSSDPPPDVSSVVLVSIGTSGHDVQFDPRELGSGDGPWLVSHVPDHISQPTIAETSLESGTEAIKAICSA